MSESPQELDVLIIGGGVIGLCSAWYLQQRGYSVAIVDKGEIGQGSSAGNAGLIVPSHFVPLAAPGVVGQGLKWMFNPDSPFYIKPRANLDLIRWLWKFARASTQAHVERSMPLLLDMHLQSLALFEQLADENALDFGFEQNGVLMLYHSAVGEKECDELVEAAAHLDLQLGKLSAAAVSEKLPNLDLNIAGGAWLPQDAHLNPSRLIRVLSDGLKNAGVKIFTHTEVTELIVQNDQVAGVQTTKGGLFSREVVLAGGAWSANIARQLNLNIPLQAAKGYSLMAPSLAGKLNIPLLLAESKIALTPLQEGVRFAGTLEMAGIDLTINGRRVENIRRGASAYSPDLKISDQEMMNQKVWVGMRPLTPDGLPIIGRTSSFKNLTIATGHAMMGVSLAPITGKVVSEIIDGEKTSIRLDQLALERF